MSNSSSDFQKNRRRLPVEQVNYWRYNLGSGFLRFTERILFGFNVSDILGGDLGQIKHLEDVKIQLVERKQIETALLPSSAPAWSCGTSQPRARSSSWRVRSPA